MILHKNRKHIYFLNKNKTKKIIKNKSIDKLILKKNIFNYFFINYFLTKNYQIFSKMYIQLKKKYHNKIIKNILKLRQLKIFPYSI